MKRAKPWRSEVITRVEAVWLIHERNVRLVDRILTELRDARGEARFERGDNVNIAESNRHAHASHDRALELGAGPDRAARSWAKRFTFVQLEAIFATFDPPELRDELADAMHVHVPVPTRDQLYACRTCTATLRRKNGGAYVQVTAPAVPDVALAGGDELVDNFTQSVTGSVGVRVRRKPGA